MCVPMRQSCSDETSSHRCLSCAPCATVRTSTRSPATSTTLASYQSGLSAFSDRISQESPSLSRRQSSVRAKSGCKDVSSSRSIHESQRDDQPLKWTFTLVPGGSSTSTTTESNHRPSESRASTASPGFNLRRHFSRIRSRGHSSLPPGVWRARTSTSAPQRGASRHAKIAGTPPSIASSSPSSSCHSFSPSSSESGPRPQNFSDRGRGSPAVDGPA
mmetsp:Transcript_3372/g.10422  ORF Transcript_3372/g.10422 Transcript_3372/m.10422 type:complete len:217 (+) Transcript_3372:1868-2518(+)